MKEKLIIYNQLIGSYDLKAQTISTDGIPYKNIYTLKRIDKTQTIRDQMKNLQNTLFSIGSITISGVTFSGFVLLDRLTAYYDTSTYIFNRFVNNNLFTNNYCNNLTIRSLINSKYLTLSNYIATNKCTIDNNFIRLSNYITSNYYQFKN